MACAERLPPLGAALSAECVGHSPGCRLLPLLACSAIVDKTAQFVARNGKLTIRL